MYFLLLLVIIANSSANDSDEYNHSVERCLTRIHDYCWTPREIEELYGNKTTHIIVLFFAKLLTHSAYQQLGLDETRRHFHLRSQPINAKKKSKEKFIRKPKRNDKQKVLDYFDSQVYFWSANSITNQQSWLEDIKIAAEYLDGKFPEIRQLFQLKFAEKHLNTFTTQTVDAAVIIFSELTQELWENFSYSLDRSSQALSGWLMSKCSNKH